MKIRDELVDEEKEEYLSVKYELGAGVEKIERVKKIITENGTKKKIVKVAYYKEERSITKTKKRIFIFNLYRLFELSR